MKRSIFRGKIVLVTGGTGTIGSELVHQVLREMPRQVRVFSRDDTRQYELEQSLPTDAPVRFLIGDIRDRERLAIAMRGVDIVLHAAALKHVPASEYNPYEAVQTNIIGSQNVIELAILNKVERVLAISTDKAANPKNVLGTSKLMMEKLFTNANFTFGLHLKQGGIVPTRFSSVRFGNVAWARGSVLPAWRASAERKGTIMVTDRTMTRFMMSKEQAIRLVLEATELMRGSEIFVLKMPAITLGSLARAFIKKYYPKKRIRIVEGRNRGGEKKHEELLLEDDAGDVFENKRMFIYVPHPPIRKLKPIRLSYSGFKLAKPRTYSSRTSIDERAVEKMI